MNGAQMAKKRAGKKGNTKNTRKKNRAKFNLSTYSVLATITIEKGNAIADPAPLVVPPRSAVVWIVDNQDTRPHDVSIDPRVVTNKKNGRKEHPFTKSAVLSCLGVPAGGRDVMFALTKGGLVRERYKYEIASTNDNGTAIKLDPDLDVVDPNSGRPPT